MGFYWYIFIIMSHTLHVLIFFLDILPVGVNVHNCSTTLFQRIVK